MSKLSKLIQELCPDGVEYKSLNKIACYSKERVEAADVSANNYVGVDNLLPNKKGKTISTHTPSTGNLIHYEKDDILIGNIRPYLKKIWLADIDGGTNGDVLVIHIYSNEAIAPKFLYYVLSSDNFFLYDMQNAKGAKMPRGSKSAIMQYCVPAPTLEVQQEIVRILDSFTELTAELTAELTTELTARKQQYEYYRDKLLTFDTQVQRLKISEICKNISSGGTPKSGNKEYYGGSIPWLRTQDINWIDIYDTSQKITEAGLEKSSANWIPPNCVIVAMYGATAAKVAINKIPLTTNQACCNLEIDENVASYRYVFHWLCKEYHNLKAMGQGSQANINAQIIKEYPIPVPSLTIQRKIVSSLDHFDALCNDLSNGLPAEIEARQKQYEYYRDRLLTFKEKMA